MLIQFRVENYKSFDSEQTLSMVAGLSRNNEDHLYDAGDVKILKTAVIFGANASGKSNIIKAMAAMRNYVVFNIPIPTNDYCRVKSENKDKPTGFEFTVSVDGRKYAYGLEILLSTGEIQNEWFIDFTNTSHGSSIFSRSKKGITTELKLGDERKYFDVYKYEATRAKVVPFLTILSRLPLDMKSGLKAVHKIFRWFSNSLRIIGAGAVPGFRFTKRREQFTRNILPAYGTGISGIEYHNLNKMNNPIPVDVLNNAIRAVDRQNVHRGEPCGLIDGGAIGKFPIFINERGEPVVKKMMFDHDGNLFEYYEESDGTNRLFDLTPILDPQDEKDLVYVIDELDRSLHPQLTKKFVSDFEKLDSRLQRQLITTSHESRLMDLRLLRRDELWFIDKMNGVSSLYSLEEFNERMDRRVDKAYMDGRYGAVPCFREIFPDLE